MRDQKAIHKLENEVRYYVWLHGVSAESERQYSVDKLNELLDRYEEQTGRPFVFIVDTQFMNPTRRNETVSTYHHENWYGDGI